MTAVVVVVNIVLIASVLIGIVGSLAWAIVSSASDLAGHPAPRVPQPAAGSATRPTTIAAPAIRRGARVSSAVGGRG